MKEDMAHGHSSKEAGVALWIQDDFKAENITTDKGHFMMAKGQFIKKT